MKVLVAGGAGMLGHRLYLELRREHDVAVTVRGSPDAYARHGVFDPRHVFGGVDVMCVDRMLEIVGTFKPDVIVNAVGLIKHRLNAKDVLPSAEINTVLPHRLALIARAVGARLVHFSTDCVFSGRKGMYTELDVPDAEDVYGRTKLLGELVDPPGITLRASLIGHELENKASLVEWFLAQRGRVDGFRRAIFSGFTTTEMARIVRMLIERSPDSHGVWHVSSDPIDKYTLLNLIKKHYGVATQIEPNDTFVCDRSLDSTRFRSHFQYTPPSWEAMIVEMSRQAKQQQGLNR